MNPREYYRMKTAQITEADVKKVAEVMADPKVDQMAYWRR